jgi:hypothetical protein
MEEGVSVILYSRWNCHHSSLKDFVGDFHPDRWAEEPERHRQWKYQGRMERFRKNDEWLRNRLELFKTFTYPSVLSQTNQKFSWLGLVHEDSPKWFLDELTQFDRMEVKLVDYDTDATVLGQASVNLDTDDAIARTFIEQARAVDFEGETVFRYGLKYRVYSGKWLPYNYDNAHFNMIQHPENTVLDYLHGRADLPKNIIKTKAPMWMQVIHERNVANAMRTPRSKKNPPKNVEQEEVEESFDIDYDNLSKNLILEYTK